MYCVFRFYPPILSETFLTPRRIQRRLSYTAMPVAAWRGSAAAHLLGLRVRIPPGGGHGCLSLESVVCCHGKVSAMG